MRIFRSHTEVPVVANPTLAGLAREWVAINTAAEYHRQVAKLHQRLPDPWRHRRRHRPFSHGLRGPRPAAPDSDQRRRLPSATDLVAGLPTEAAGTSQLSANADDLDTRLQDRIVEFLENVANYPGHITKNVPMELLRRPRWRRTDGTHGYGHEPDLEGHLTLAEELTPEGHDADEDSGEKLEALFADAMSTGMCSPEELELLREFHLDEFQLRCGR